MEYEGFSNYHTWLCANICDNEREVYDVVQRGLQVVAKRYKCGDPNASSYPFTTTGRGASEAEPRLRDYVLKTKGIDVVHDMSVTLSTGLIYNQIIAWALPDDEYPTFDSQQVNMRELCEHLLGMYFDKHYQEVHYARERK